MVEKKYRICGVSDNQQHNYSLRQIMEWSDLRNIDPEKIGEPKGDRPYSKGNK